MHKLNDIRYFYETISGVEMIFSDHSTISYPLHNHVSVFTIGMVLDGSIVLHDNHGSQIYTKGQFFVISPYMPHSIKANNRYSLLSICIDKNLLHRSSYDIDKMKITITNMLIQSVGLCKINKNQIFQLLNCLTCFHDIEMPFLLNPNVCIINELKKQLELFPERKFSVEEMAHAAFISKFHFIRSFKLVVGLTPHQFQLQNRIRKAQRLLSKGNTITEVACLTGFCDQSHFIKQFEKRVGLTPTLYKSSCDVRSLDFTLS